MIDIVLAESALARGLAWVNAILATLIVLRSIAYYRRFWRRPLSLLMIIIASYWSLLYYYVSLSDLGLLPERNHDTFGAIFVRPAFTLTLAGMVYIVYRAKRREM